VIPALLVFQTFDGQPAWRAVWPLFGSTNQLLAALALVTFAVYLRVNDIKAGFVIAPTLVMLIMPLGALAMMAHQYWGKSVMMVSTCVVMFLLGVFVAFRSLKVLIATTPPGPEPEPVAEQAGA
jgi:carbon starvation protein